MELRSGLLGGRKRNRALRGRARLSRMTTSPRGRMGELGLDIGVERGAVHQAVDDHGAVSPKHRSPAMKVCVPQWPNGASMRNWSPHGQLPRSRTIFVFTHVSSINKPMLLRPHAWLTLCDPHFMRKPQRRACAFRPHQGFFLYVNPSATRPRSKDGGATRIPYVPSSLSASSGMVMSGLISSGRRSSERERSSSKKRRGKPRVF